MAIVEVKVPQLSESVAEATLLQWKKKTGDSVEMDEILIDIETDKVILEVPAPGAGVLVEVVQNDGATVNAEQGIAGTDTEASPRAAAPAAERVLQTQSTNAVLTTLNGVNMGPVVAMRRRFQEKFEKEHGVKLGFMSFFVKAAVHALKKYPVLNASVDGNDIVYHGYFDIGIAVGSPRGLVVPILRNADQMSFADIEKKIAEYGAKARDGKLGMEEMTGGTFSISNGGVFGSMLSTPIINPPQS